jgi:PTS system nitrogen regulatory IIA component
MEIKDCLAPADVLVDVRASDKARLLEDLSKRGATTLALDVGLVSGAILKREELGSTGVGGGVAIPHARIQDVRKPFGIMARLKKPLAFDAIDGLPVDIVFFLVLPTTPAGEALNTLAAVSRKLRNPQVIGSIRQAGEAADIYQALIAGAAASAGG